MAATALRDESSAAAARPARYRYGVVFVLTLTLLVFLIVAPATSWSRAAATALEGAALLVVVATSRDRVAVRRARALTVGVAGAGLALAIGTDLLSRAAAFATSGLLVTAVIATLSAGAVRLIGHRGATAQSVAAGLAIYVLVGILFAWIMAFVAEVGDQPFFTAGHPATASALVYFSFTVLTTTGFGDYTAASQVGHAISVVEMLIGQLYLVTIIGVLVGGFAGRRGATLHDA